MIALWTSANWNGYLMDFWWSMDWIHTFSRISSDFLGTISGRDCVRDEPQWSLRDTTENLVIRSGIGQDLAPKSAMKFSPVITLSLWESNFLVPKETWKCHARLLKSGKRVRCLKKQIGGSIQGRIPSHHPFLDGIFHYKPTILGYPQ